MSEHAGMYLKKISEKLEKRANANAHKREFTFSQGKVLWYLHKRDGENVTMRDIERFLDCSHATVSGLVSRLEEKGLVCMEQSASDRRAKVVKLTEKEWNNFRAMQAHRREMETLLLQGFSAEERTQFLAYLQRVYQNVSDGEEPCRCHIKYKKGEGKDD
jgi:MarR family multiple gene transcriptional regulator MgrA